MNRQHEVILYQIDETNVCVNVIFKDETFWLSQKLMAELFDCSTDNISLHLRNIYAEEELDEKATVEYFSVVQKEGIREVNRNLKCYNLDAIIAVGYRVNSKKATRFRQWATKTLKEYITKGFVLNDEMLKNGKPFGHPVTRLMHVDGIRNDFLSKTKLNEKEKENVKSRVIIYNNQNVFSLQ